MIKILFVKRNRSYLLKSIIAWKNEKIKILAKVACPELLVLGVDKQKCMYVYLWVIFFISFRRFRGSPQLWGSGSRSFWKETVNSPPGFSMVALMCSG